MELDGISGQVLRICKVITKMAYINLLWILFTLLGLVLFGFMPATVALFTVTRKWVRGEKKFPVFSTFWQAYRKDFLKSTLLGAILFAIGGILYIDFIYFQPGGIFTIIRGGLIICSLLYLIILLYIFPVYVHYKMKERHYIKYAFLMGAANPHFTLLMMTSIGLLFYFIYTFPVAILFFSASVLSYIMMWTANQVFMKIDTQVQGQVQQFVEPEK